MGPRVILNVSVLWMDEFNSLNQASGTDRHYWWLLLCFTSSVKLFWLNISRKQMGKGYDECCEFWAEKKKKKSQAFKQFKCRIRFLNLVWPSKTGSCLTGKLWGAPYAWKIIKWDHAFQDSYLHYGAQSRNSSMTEATLSLFLLENLCSVC